MLNNVGVDAVAVRWTKAEMTSLENDEQNSLSNLPPLPPLSEQDIPKEVKQRILQLSLFNKLEDSED